jgi:glycine cleavage system aminomethyltransferase T
MLVVWTNCVLATATDLPNGSMVDFFRMVKKGEQIGKVTSARYSPRPEKSIGYRKGPIEHSEVGTEGEVETPSEGTPLR